ncbi:MAG TPA: SDR family oxidoreductase, partial [Phycisphaeraceae bacterium]
TKPFTQITDEEFDRLMATNLRAVFRLSRQVLQAITKPGGAIVNVASVHGRQPMPQFSVYAASKGAIEALTRGMAVDHGPEGVRVNCIIPGMVDCPQTRQVMGRVVPDVEAYLKQWISRNQLLPQLVTNDNVGDLVAFLLGPKSQGITAQSIIIDAGTLTQMVDRDG